MLISLGAYYQSQAQEDLLASVQAMFDADLGALIVPDPNLTTLWIDEARTIQATSDGDPVWWVDDLSGNGNHFPAPLSAQRPILRTNGETWWLEHNGFVRLTIPDAGLTTTASTMGWSLHKYPSPDGGLDRGMLRGGTSNSSSTGSWFFVFEPGSSGDAFNNVATPGTVYTDNVSASVITRAQANTQVTSGDPIITSGTVLGADFTTTTNYLLSYTTNASGAADFETFYGDLFAYMEIGRVLTADERATLNAFLKSRRRAA